VNGGKPRTDELEVPESTRIGGYSLATELDAGTLGSRWLGYVTQGPERGRLVAARRIKTGSDITAATKLDQAAQLARAIRHAKITAVLDVVRSPSEVVVVSEHMDGEPLSSLLSLAARANVPIPPAVALAVIRDIVDASMAVRDAWDNEARGKDSLLRRSGHGGLHPDTVLVATFGEALLTEPGITGTAAALPRYAKHASALPYRAPEQLTPPARVDERSDVFSVGVMMWELLAGTPLFGPDDRLRRPASSGSVPQIEQQVRDKPIPSLDTVQRPGAPIHPEVAVLVARAVQRDPANRYSSLAELRAAIDQLPAGRVATEEQVAATVDRLARDRIEARRAAFERIAGGRVMESAPPSSMATDRPAPPSHPLSILIPANEWREDSLAELTGFSATEAPTRSGAAGPSPTPARSGAVAPSPAPTRSGAAGPAQAVDKLGSGDDSSRPTALPSVTRGGPPKPPVREPASPPPRPPTPVHIPAPPLAVSPAAKATPPAPVDVTPPPVAAVAPMPKPTPIMGKAVAPAPTDAPEPSPTARLAPPAPPQPPAASLDSGMATFSTPAVSTVGRASRRRGKIAIVGLGVLLPMAVVLGVVTLLNTRDPEPGPSAEPDTVPVAKPEPAAIGDDATEQVTETASSAAPSESSEPAANDTDDALAPDSAKDQPRPPTPIGPSSEKPESNPLPVEGSGPPPGRDGKAFRPNGI